MGSASPAALRVGAVFGALAALFNFLGVLPLATTNWGAKNTARYYGEPAISWTERPALKLKTLVQAALAQAPAQ